LLQEVPAYDLPSPMSNTTSDGELQSKYENLLRVNEALVRDVIELRQAMQSVRTLANKMENADKRQVTDMESNRDALKHSVGELDSKLNRYLPLQE